MANMTRFSLAVLQSLNEFYDDARHEGFECPDEAEFRAYYLITHLRDSDTIRQTELLSTHIFNSRYIQSALRLQSLVLRNNESRGERGRRPANSEASLNAFSRFFKAVAKDDTSYLLACLAESHFTDVRRGALVALKKAYIERNPQYPLPKLAKMLGCNNVAHCAEVVENFGLGVVYDAAGTPVSVELHRKVALQGQFRRCRIARFASTDDSPVNLSVFVQSIHRSSSSAPHAV